LGGGKGKEGVEKKGRIVDIYIEQEIETRKPLEICPERRKTERGGAGYDRFFECRTEGQPVYKLTI